MKYRTTVVPYQKTSWRKLILNLPVVAAVAAAFFTFPAAAQTAGLTPLELERRALEYRAMIDRNEKGIIPTNALPIAVQEAQKIPFDQKAWPGVTAPMTSAAYTPGVAVAGIDTNLWTWIGPGNIGGRIRAILIHPTQTNTMWIGGVAGGVWKTTNGGASWFPCNDFMANLAVVTLVMDPANPNTIYAGTGEGTFNADAVRGAGIFKSTDGGTNWTQLPATATSSFYYVNRLSICPTNGSILLAATASGIWRSADGGSTWSQRTNSPYMEDIVFDPTGANAVASGNSGQLMYSTDGGVTWNGAAGISTSQRIEIAYAASSPNIVYASANISSGEVYVSADGGQSYSYLSNPQHLGNQGWYDNCIWVDPTNPNLLVVGGTDLFRSTDGGNTWTDIGGYTGGIHPDQHAIVSIPGYNGSSVSTVFIGNDGGFFRAGNITTVSSGSGWTTLNNNLGITQFYGAAGNNVSGTIVGGAQDNGTVRVLGNGGTGSFTSMYGGDGGFCAADQSDTNYFYGEYIYLQIHRSSNAGVSSAYITTGLGDAGLPDSNGVFQPFYPPDPKTPPASDPDGGTGSGPDPDSAANFIAPFVLDPNNFNTMVAGGSNLWRSVNVKASTPAWGIIKPGIASGSFINAVAVAAGHSDIIWVGYNNGSVYYTTNGTAANPTWVQSGSGTLPGRACTRLAIDPYNYNTVYATFGGYSSGNVYKTINGGASWSNIGGALPSAPVNSIVIAPFNDSYLYAGMNVGVFASTDGGSTWSSGNLGAANVAVDELFWMTNNTLVAATHGRGLFKVSIIPDELQILPYGGFAASGYPGGPFVNTNQTYVLTNTGVASLNWNLVNTSAWLQVSLTSGSLAPGGPAATVAVSLTSAANALPIGNYAATIAFTNTSDGYVQTRQFMLQVAAIPDALQVSPAGGIIFTGTPGAVYGLTQNFNLTNTGGSSLNWSLMSTSAWFSASPSSGTLGAGAGGAVVMTAMAAANSLPVGNYPSTVWFTNRSDGVVLSRPVTMMIEPLLLNGGFETGDLSYWTTSGNFQYSGVSSTPAYVHSGTFGMELGPVGSLGYLSQTLPTAPGQLYLLSFWLNNSAGGSPNEFTATWGGTNLVDAIDQSTAAWSNYVFFVTATTGSTLLQFGFQNDPNYFGFDDVSVTPVSMPVFQGLARAGTDFDFSWSAQTGLVYQVQYTTNLASGNWINLGGIINATNASIMATDTNAFNASPQRFYRLQLFP